jgi:hypothetical protein
MSDTKAETTESNPTTTTSKDQTINSDSIESPAVVDADQKNTADILTEEKTSTNGSGETKSEVKSLSDAKAEARILRLSGNVEVHEDKSKNVKFDPSALEASSDPVEIRKQVSASVFLVMDPRN